MWLEGNSRFTEFLLSQAATHDPVYKLNKLQNFVVFIVKKLLNP